MLLMTYEWGYTYGPSMVVALLGDNFHIIKLMEKHKIRVYDKSL